MPEARHDGPHHQQCAVLHVRDKAVGASGKHRRRAGHVEQHAGPDDAGAERARRRIARAGDDRHACRQAEVARGVRRRLADDLPWGDDPGHPFEVDAEPLALRLRPAPLLRVDNSAEVQKGVVHEGVVRLQPREPPGDVARRRHELGDPPILLRPLVLPPQHLGGMRAGRRTAGERRDLVGMVPHQRVDVGLAAHVEPGIEAHRGAEIFVDRADPRHLAVEGDRRDLACSDPASLNDVAHRPARRGVEILLVLLDHAGRWIGEGDFRRCLGDKRAVRPVERRLRGARAEIDADQVAARHPLRLAGCGGAATGRR